MGIAADPAGSASRALRRLHRRLQPSAAAVERRGRFPDLSTESVTITVGTANAHATLVDSATPNHLVTHPAFLYAGGVPIAAGPNTPKNSMYIATPPSGNNLAQPLRAAFAFDDDVFEWWTLGTGGFYRVWIDGKPLSIQSMAGPASNGNTYFIKFLFNGGRADRVIEFDLANQYFGGIMTKATATVSPPPHNPSEPLVVGMFDSFGEGTGTYSPIDSFFWQLTMRLGFHNVHQSSAGGTGFVNPGTSRYALPDRIGGPHDDVIKLNPDIVVAGSGLNDLSYTQSQIRAGVANTVVPLLAADSAPTVVVIGVFTGSTGSIATAPGVSAWIVDEARTRGAHLVIDPQTGMWYTSDGRSGPARGATGPWVFGTGRYSVENGTGNADYYRGPPPDPTHPSPNGHSYLAHRCAADWLAALPFGR